MIVVGASLAGGDAALGRTSDVDGGAFALPPRGRPISEVDMIPCVRAHVDDVVELDVGETGVDGQSNERLVETRGRRAEDRAEMPCISRKHRRSKVSDSMPDSRAMICEPLAMA